MNFDETTTTCENSLSSALGYNAFIRYEVTLRGGDTEGKFF